MSAMNYVNMTTGALIAELLERDGECVKLRAVVEAANAFIGVVIPDYRNETQHDNLEAALAVLDQTRQAGLEKRALDAGLYQPGAIVDTKQDKSSTTGDSDGPCATSDAVDSRLSKLHPDCRGPWEKGMTSYPTGEHIRDCDKCLEWNRHSDRHSAKQKQGSDD